MDAARLQRKQTVFDRHVQAGLNFYADGRTAYSIYRWMARAQFDRAARCDLRRANEIADFYTAHGEHRAATHFARTQMQDPTCRRDAAAWSRLADTYVREADAPHTSAKRQTYCRAQAMQARERAEAVAQPAAAVAPPGPAAFGRAVPVAPKAPVSLA